VVDTGVFFPNVPIKISGFERGLSSCTKCMLANGIISISSSMTDVGKSDTQYKGPIDVIRQLYKEGGFRSIYRGTGATLLRDIPASGAYLSVFEFLKKRFSGDSTKLSPMATLMAGGFAGIANWAVCIPADVLKSRLQTAPHGKYPDGIRGVLREILREEGPRALFKGFVPIMLRAFPANAACFLGVDFTLSLFKKIS